MTVEKQYMGWYDDKEHEFSIGTAIFKLLLKRFGNTLNLFNGCSSFLEL